jgi:hypothetical protein
MSSPMKFVVGLVAALLVIFLYHAPLRGGAALINRIEAGARANVARTEVPEISVNLGRDPLSRTATLSGNADDVQRTGMGEMPGLNQIVENSPGVAGVRWADDGGSSAFMPLLGEALLAGLTAYLLGYLIGSRLFGRPRNRSYLD